ncbi:MAG: Ig-like domain-containing protein, partial [Solirubrobacteraceae bacterium]
MGAFGAALLGMAAMAAPAQAASQPKLALQSLVTSGRISHKRARSLGFRLVMRFRERTQVVRVRVYRLLAGGERRHRRPALAPGGALLDGAGSGRALRVRAPAPCRSAHDRAGVRVDPAPAVDRVPGGCFSGDRPTSTGRSATHRTEHVMDGQATHTPHRAKGLAARSAVVAALALMALLSTAALASASVVIDKTGPTSAERGVNFDFTITVTNPATMFAATDVVVTDALPTGLELVAVTGVGCNQGSTTVQCALGTIEAGEFRSVLITVRSDAEGGYDNIASVTSNPAAATSTDNHLVEVKDTIAPQTVISSAPSAMHDSTTASFTFAIASVSGAPPETAVSFECRLDAAATGFAPCDASHTISGLAQGPHTLGVRAVDAAGNADATPATSTFTVDSIAPDPTLTAPTGLLRTASPTFTGQAGQAAGDEEALIITIIGTSSGATASRTLPATRQPDGSFSAPLTGALDQGSYRATVSQSDATGNTGTSAPITFTVDTVAPTV